MVGAILLLLEKIKLWLATCNACFKQALIIQNSLCRSKHSGSEFLGQIHKCYWSAFLQHMFAKYYTLFI